VWKLSLLKVIYKSSFLFPSKTSDSKHLMIRVLLSVKVYSCVNFKIAPVDIFVTLIYKSDSVMTKVSISQSKETVI